MTTKLTPQEKKALSYARDTRNTLHENDKASRRLIPLRKARVNRAYRKKVNEVLREAPETRDVHEIELLGDTAASIKRGDWTKYPDTPLGEVIERKKEEREAHAGNGKTARKRVRDFVAGLKVEVRQETDGRWTANGEGIPAGIIISGETPEKAIEHCKHVAGAYFREKIGAGEVLWIEGDSISTVTY